MVALFYIFEKSSFASKETSNQLQLFTFQRNQTQTKIVCVETERVDEKIGQTFKKRLDTLKKYQNTLSIWKIRQSLKNESFTQESSRVSPKRILGQLFQETWQKSI